jgi:two-component system invasion response regulator UvrY
MVRILIAEDHALVSHGIRLVLLNEFPFARIEQVSNAEALLAILTQQEFDVVIADFVMPGRSGLDAIQQIKLSYPSLPVLVLSAQPQEDIAVRVLKAGAAAFLSKEAPPEELIKAIHSLLLGKNYITPAVSDQLLRSLDKNSSGSPHQLLSNREFQVMKLIAVGQPLSDIARQLSLSVATVSTYRARILEKMDIRTNAQITMYAVAHSLL